MIVSVPFLCCQEVVRGKEVKSDSGDWSKEAMEMAVTLMQAFSRCLWLTLVLQKQTVYLTLLVINL